MGPVAVHHCVIDIALGCGRLIEEPRAIAPVGTGDRADRSTQPFLDPSRVHLRARHAGYGLPRASPHGASKGAPWPGSSSRHRRRGASGFDAATATRVVGHSLLEGATRGADL